MRGGRNAHGFSKAHAACEKWQGRNRKGQEGKQGAAYWIVIMTVQRGEKAKLAKPKAKMSLHSHLTRKCLGCCLRAAGPKAHTAYSSEQWWTGSLKGITNFNDRKKLYDQLSINQKRHTTSQVVYTIHKKLKIEESPHHQKQLASLQP